MLLFSEVYFSSGLYEFCQLSCGGSVASAVKLNKQAARLMMKSALQEEWEREMEKEH